VLISKVKLMSFTKILLLLVVNEVIKLDIALIILLVSIY